MGRIIPQSITKMQVKDMNFFTKTAVVTIGFLTKIDTAIGEQAIIYTSETFWRTLSRSIERVSRDR